MCVCISASAQAPRPHMHQGNLQVSILQTLKDRPFPEGILESLGEKGHSQDETQGMLEGAAQEK